jgi:hypothetical protein
MAAAAAGDIHVQGGQQRLYRRGLAQSRAQGRGKLGQRLLIGALLERLHQLV